MSPGIHRQAVASFSIFFFVFWLDMLVSVIHIIPERSTLNLVLTWFFIIPAVVIGVTLSVIVLKTAYIRKKHGGRLIDNNVLIALPLILYLSFYVVMYASGTIF